MDKDEREPKPKEYPLRKENLLVIMGFNVLTDLKTTVTIKIKF